MGNMREHNEVYFALFGRDVSNNEPVSVTFRYCPYLMLRTLQEARSFHFTHSDVVQLTPLHGFTLEKISCHRVFVPIKKEWERGKKERDVLDYHHTLITQMLSVLGLKPLDVVECGSVVSRLHHTNVTREYDIRTRLSADRRLQFPIIIEPQNGILCTRPTIMSFDVEAYSSDGSFPNTNNSHTIAICYSLQELDGTIMKEDKLVHKTERDLLLAFYDAVLNTILILSLAGIHKDLIGLTYLREPRECKFQTLLIWTK